MAIPVEAVISASIATPPASPSFFDAYLVPAAPTGAWAGHTDSVAVYTSRGWLFTSPRIGWLLYVEATDGFLRYTAAGAWVSGFGAAAIAPSSVPMFTAINFGRRVIVENQTTNTPPAAILGIAYIVGPSPTGVWAGKAAQVAICEIPDNWTFYDPSAGGMQAYDKALAADFTFTSGSWRTSASAYIGRARAVDNASSALSGTGLAQGSNVGTDTVAPVTGASARSFETLTLNYTAHKAGATIEVTYQAAFAVRFQGQYTPGSGASGVIRMWCCLFVDSETTARDWTVLDSDTSANGVQVVPQGPDSTWNVTFITTLADTNVHTIKIAFIAAISSPGSMGSSPSDTTTHPTVRNRSILIREVA